jgi:hypothetical protein
MYNLLNVIVLTPFQVFSILGSVLLLLAAIAYAFGYLTSPSKKEQNEIDS